MIVFLIKLIATLLKEKSVSQKLQDITMYTKSICCKSLKLRDQLRLNSNADFILWLMNLNFQQINPEMTEVVKYLFFIFLISLVKRRKATWIATAQESIMANSLSTNPTKSSDILNNSLGKISGLFSEFRGVNDHFVGLVLKGLTEVYIEPYKISMVEFFC